MNFLNVKATAQNSRLKIAMFKSKRLFSCRLLDRCHESEKSALRQKSREFCQKLYKNCQDKPPVYLLATLVELNKADGKDVEETCKLCDDLASQYDVIRGEYWSYIKRSIQMSQG